MNHSEVFPLWSYMHSGSIFIPVFDYVLSWLDRGLQSAVIVINDHYCNDTGEDYF